jgi:HlyD family secretion protein
MPANTAPPAAAGPAVSAPAASATVAAADTAAAAPPWRRPALAIAVLAAALALAYAGWRALQPAGYGPGFSSGNGRIEATEVDVATKLPGRVDRILVDEGDYVKAGQELARMQVQSLQAQRDEAAAREQQARDQAQGALAQVAVRVSDSAAAQALLAQRESELDAAMRRLSRSSTLVREGAASEQEVDDDGARVRNVMAARAAAQAQVNAADAAIEAARSQLVGARSAVTAAVATTARIDADLADAVLVAPRSGRVQYRVAQAGEVLGAGGKVLNLVDVSDVYLTFFLPETAAGRVGMGSEVRLVLDAAPQYVIPAKVTYVASAAQFTPKSVETASERQKLMFRVKAQIDRELLLRHLPQVKTGLPGVAWIRTDPQAAWPQQLAVRVPQ